jgi:hypothetical protein
MERDFLAAIGKEQPDKGAREESGTHSGLLSPPCRAGFLDLPPHPAVFGFLPCRTSLSLSLSAFPFIS